MGRLYQVFLSFSGKKVKLGLWIQLGTRTRTAVSIRAVGGGGKRNTTNLNLLYVIISCPRREGRIKSRKENTA